MMREAVDFHFVPQQQEAIHLRLLNWARAQRSSSGQSCAPMFRQYRSSDQWATPNASSPVDQRDAAKINKAWQQLPAKHRASLGWHYVTPSSPTKACKAIGCTMEDLARLVVDARAMLINRRV
jgi:DNA-directed RNA polymerase specialized sigma24 family protein